MPSVKCKEILTVFNKKSNSTSSHELSRFTCEEEIKFRCARRFCCFSLSSLPWTFLLRTLSLNDVTENRLAMKNAFSSVSCWSERQFRLKPAEENLSREIYVRCHCLVFLRSRHNVMQVGVWSFQIWIFSFVVLSLEDAMFYTLESQFVTFFVFLLSAVTQVKSDLGKTLAKVISLDFILMPFPSWLGKRSSSEAETFNLLHFSRIKIHSSEILALKANKVSPETRGEVKPTAECEESEEDTSGSPLY